MPSTLEPAPDTTTRPQTSAPALVSHAHTLHTDGHISDTELGAWVTTTHAYTVTGS